MAGESEAEGWRRRRNGWLAVKQPSVSSTVMRSASWIPVAYVSRIAAIRAEAGRWSFYCPIFVMLSRNGPSLLLAVFVNAAQHSAVPRE